MNLDLCCKYHDLTARICALAISLAITAVPVLAADDIPPSGHGGGGIISDQTCLKTASKTVTEVCAKYRVSWKLWTLMGEPVGDYRLKWEFDSLTLAGWYPYNARNMPVELEKEIKRIELYLDVVADVYLGPGWGGYGIEAHHPFNTGVATRAGQLSYNTPGSPKWSELFLSSVFYFGDRSQGYLPEKEARALFKRSKQPELPLNLRNLKFGPKSAFSGLDGLENKIAELCRNKKTAPSFSFCPAIVEMPKKEAKSKPDQQRNDPDPFARLEKGKGKPASTSGTGATDPFASLEKGNSINAEQGIDARFAAMEARLANVERQRKIAKYVEAPDDKGKAFCEAVMQEKAKCLVDVCGRQPEQFICLATIDRPNSLMLRRVQWHPNDSIARPTLLAREATRSIILINPCPRGRPPNPKYNEWEACMQSSPDRCKVRDISSGSMKECLLQRAQATIK